MSSRNTPFHHGSHRALLRLPEHVPTSVNDIDAIIVPSARCALYLHSAASLAEALDCSLVVISSRRSRRAEVVAEMAKRFPRVDLVAIELPPAAALPLPAFETSRMLAGTPFDRRTDTSTKRNLGLLIARTVGWKHVTFLDDDVTVADPAHLRVAASLLTTHDAVGLAIRGYPDNSVVCHAHRGTGGWQETFVGGGALAVPAQRAGGFFPDIYNEDWFFLLDDVKLRPVAEVGEGFQRRYDPFSDPARARGEEFGDVLAEGVFWLLDRGRRVRDADEKHWGRFLANRAAFIAGVLDRVAKKDTAEPGERRRMTESLKAARGRLQLITPRLCVEYLRAWRADNTRWRRCLADLPSCLSIRETLRRLGLAGRFTVRDSRTRTAGPRPAEIAEPVSGAAVTGVR